MVAVAAVAFLWPTRHPRAGEVVAGSVDEVRARQVVYLSEYGVFVVAAAEGFLALSDDARHIGDRVLYCAEDDTFSSPAHGERFDRLGRYVAGPAVGDMARHPIRVEASRVVVDISAEPELPGRSPTSDRPAGTSCQGPEGPPGFYQGGVP